MCIRDRFIPVSIKTRKGEDEPTLAAKSAVADLAKFGRLARYTQKKLLEMGQALRNGSIEACLLYTSCRRCGVLHSNRAAADDNPIKLMSIAMKPVAFPPFPLERIEELTALMGGDGAVR